MPHGDDETWIQTFTGRQFWPLDPKAEDIDIRDIAHALALKCRYTGHCREFYSIAQHSCLVGAAVEDKGKNSFDHRLCLTALLHDAAEAYTADIARPVKKSIAQFAEIEHRLESVIAKKFGLLFPFPGVVKWADNCLLATERRDLMATPPRPWRSVEAVEPLRDTLVAVTWEESERRFLAQFTRWFRG